MVKSLSAGLDTHLQQEGTTICSCWKITRVDGTILGFTDHDIDITIDLGDGDGSITYDAESGFLRSAISNNAGLSPDTLEVDGFIDASYITREDLLNGVYDFASVDIFIVNYENTSQGAMYLRSGWFGEVTMSQSGKFTVELRGLIDILDNKVGRLFEPECNADLGDERCAVQLEPDLRLGSTVYALGDRVIVPNTSTATGVALTITNPGFETGDATGWTFSGAAGSAEEAGNKIAPRTGTYFGRSSQSNGDFYQDISLTPGSPITTTKIDNGEYTLDLRFWFNLREWGFNVGAELEFYDGGMTLINSGNDDIIVAEARYIEREWREMQVKGLVPANARTARIKVSWTKDTLQETTSPFATPAFDDFSLNMFETAIEDVSYDEYQNREFECTTAGTSAATVPTMDYTLSNTTADGTVVWTAVLPNYTFSDTIATVTDNKNFTVTNNTEADNQFRYGICEFLDGDNAGSRIEIKAWTLSTKSVELELKAKFTPVVAGKVKLIVGCSKDRSSDFGCNFFSNVENFRGFPDVPGTDEYFKIGGVSKQKKKKKTTGGSIT